MERFHEPIRATLSPRNADPNASTRANIRGASVQTSSVCVSESARRLAMIIVSATEPFHGAAHRVDDRRILQHQVKDLEGSDEILTHRVRCLSTS